MIKSRLEPSFYNTFNLQNITFSEQDYIAYENLNQEISKKVLTHYEKGYILISDLELLLVPKILVSQQFTIKIHLILNFPLPSSNHLKKNSFSKSLISSALMSSVLSFETKDDLYNFYDLIKDIFGAKLISQVGYLTIKIFGKFIIMNVHTYFKSSVLHRDLEKNLISNRAVESNDHQKKEKVFTIVSVDEIRSESGIETKYEAFQEILETSKGYTLKLFQFFVSSDDSNLDYLSKYTELANTFNERFSAPNEKIIEIYRIDQIDHRFFQNCLKSADLFLDTKLIRLDNPYIKDFIHFSSHKSSIIIREDLSDHYSEIFPTLSINPYSLHDIAMKIMESYEISSKYKKQNDEIEIINQNKGFVEQWLARSGLAIQKISIMMRSSKLFRFNLFENYETLAAGVFNMKKVSHNEIRMKYNQGMNRVIILPLEFLIEPKFLKLFKINKCFDKISSKNIHPEFEEVLNRLSSEEKNTILLITGKKKEAAEILEFQIENLNIYTENGAFYRHTNQPSWVGIMKEKISHKTEILTTMQSYKLVHPSSYIDEKESMIKFKFRKDDVSVITKTVINSLYENLLKKINENDNLEVFRTDRSVIVKPFGINKGVASQLLLQKTFEVKGKIDFLLAFGRKESDEEIFAALSKSLKMSQEIFSDVKHVCTVIDEHRPSFATCYCNSSEEVLDIFKSLL